MCASANGARLNQLPVNPTVCPTDQSNATGRIRSSASLFHFQGAGIETQAATSNAKGFGTSSTIHFEQIPRFIPSLETTGRFFHKKVANRPDCLVATIH